MHELVFSLYAGTLITLHNYIAILVLVQKLPEINARALAGNEKQVGRKNFVRKLLVVVFMNCLFHLPGFLFSMP